MYDKFKHFKKEGYGLVHVHDLGAFIVLPLKANCDLAKLLGGERHQQLITKTAKKKK